MASKSIKKRNKDSADMFKLAKGLKAKKMSTGGRAGYKVGKSVKGNKFPDHSGDGKITKKDILMAKGIIPKTKNKTKGRA